MLDDDELKATRKMHGLENDMKEIEVGDYIRTNIGTFDKIIKITISDEDEDILYLGKNIFLYSDGMIKKHSKNLIDLIKVGDFINMEYVYELGNADNRKKWIHTTSGNCYYNEDIETILTKEQYEQNCYKVEV